MSKQKRKQILAIMDPIFFDIIREVESSGFECLKPPRPASQLIITKVFAYTIYLYVFITVKIAPSVKPFTPLRLNRSYHPEPNLLFFG